MRGRDSGRSKCNHLCCCFESIRLTSYRFSRWLLSESYAITALRSCLAPTAPESTRPLSAMPPAAVLCFMFPMHQSVVWYLCVWLHSLYICCRRPTLPSPTGAAMGAVELG
jgi:hypothetical protein